MALRIINLGLQSLKYTRDNLRDFADDIDEPRLRSNYILVSFRFELILKSRIIILSDASDKDKLTSKLIGIGHDFNKISNNLGDQKLEKIGIKKIQSKTASCNDPSNPEDEYKYFIIEDLSGTEIRIEDFTDIRYGCMGGGMRTVYPKEHKKILKYISAIEELYKKIRNANTIST